MAGLVALADRDRVIRSERYDRAVRERIVGERHRQRALHP